MKAGKTDCVSSIPKTHTVEDNRLIKFHLCPSQVFIHNKYMQNISIYLKYITKSYALRFNMMFILLIKNIIIQIFGLIKDRTD